MALELDVEMKRFTLAVEPMVRADEADHVDLEAVAQAGLADAASPLEILEEVVQLVTQLVVQLLAKRGDDARQEDPPEARCRLGREEQVFAQGHPAGGRDGSGVADLQLGEEHCQRPYG